MRRRPTHRQDISPISLPTEAPAMNTRTIAIVALVLVVIVLAFLLL
ncbi:hypothetical protein SAMN04489844_0375 [Nocardioides exalbidus]|uniref:Uncharacterized protein n=1 Tax=Nocardioides exalbidus TaxID=402596 RepID=A0A1H4JZX3_9ACTN|nr:hypothetical protein [Nocardioides exalbidus]SEB51713.1 hypothetical protein SAMN04489844_0375 [Nocardioides exalbidus]